MTWGVSPKRKQDENGVYLILGAIFMVAMLSMVAIVIDLAAARQDRRNQRSAADAAATAGGLLLSNSADGRLAACNQAWKFAIADLKLPSASPSPCGTAATWPSTCNNATAAVPVFGTVNGYKITLTSPVPNSNDLMVKADAIGGGVAQPVDAAQDGSSCLRIGVSIDRTRSSLFGGIVGANSATTHVRSVGLRQSGIVKVPASFVLLDPVDCEVLNGTGSGSIHIVSNPGQTGGGILVSDGSAGCPNNKWIADASGGPGGIGINQGDLYFNSAFPGCANSGVYCDPAQIGQASGITLVPGNAGQPRPLPAGITIDRRFVDHKYNCRGNYGTSGGDPNYILAANPPRSGTALAACTDDTLLDNDYVNEFYRTVVTGTALTSGPAANPQPCGGSATYSTPVELTGNCPNNLSFTATSDVVIDDSGVSVGAIAVTGNLVLKGNATIGNTNSLSVVGNAVFRGDLTMTGGTLTISPSTAGACTGQQFVLTTSACVVHALGLGTSAATRSGYAVELGNLSQNGGDITMLRTFMYAGASSSVNLGGNGSITWTPPDDGCAADLCEPTNSGPFARLAFWDDSQSNFKLTGTGGVNMSGIYFTPAAVLDIGGNFSNLQVAQFFAYEMSQNGTGDFRLVPDEADIKVPVLGGVALIR